MSEEGKVFMALIVLAGVVIVTTGAIVVARICASP